MVTMGAWLAALVSHPYLLMVTVVMGAAFVARVAWVSRFRGPPR